MISKRDLFIASFVISILIILLMFLIISQVEIKIFPNNKNLEITPISAQTSGPSSMLDNTNSTISTSIPGVFTVGYKVRIVNTEGDGLRIRIEPGLGNSPIFLGTEGEEFIIVSGPNISDNEVWWFIEGITDTSKKGWAAQDYLMIID